MYSYRSRWKWSMVVSFHLRLTWPSLCIPPLRLYPSGQRHSLDHRTPAPTPAHTNNQCEAISSNTTCRHFFNLYGLSQFGLHIIANSLVYQIKPIPSLILKSLWKKRKINSYICVHICHQGKHIWAYVYRLVQSKGKMTYISIHFCGLPYTDHWPLTNLA